MRTIFRRKLKSGLLFSLLFFLCGCLHIMHTNDAERALEGGDYYRAALKTLYALQADDSYYRAQELLITVYPEAVRREIAAIDQAESSPGKFKWDRVVMHYKRLMELQEELIKVQPLVHKRREGEIIRFPLYDYEEKLQLYKELAAESHYNEAVSLAAMLDSRESLKEGALEFQRALSYIPNYKDAHELYLKTKEAATVKVLVLVNDWSGLQSEISRLDDLLGKALVSRVSHYKGGPAFMQVYYLTPWDLVYKASEGESLIHNELEGIGDLDYLNLANRAGYHWLFRVELNSFSYMAPVERVTTRNEWVDLAAIANLVKVIKNIVDEESNEKIEAEIVRATVKVHSVTSSFSVRAHYRLLVPEETAPVERGSLEEIVTSKVEWATYEGDERALSSHSKELSSRSPAQPAGKYELAKAAYSRVGQRLGQLLHSFDEE